ncbi:TonB-dependent siderophore receptor [Neomegalonema sp.]|uniref:TonB-dependent siderophore receptor n=1 Tax=Neomegalonema sp. TaxID=2039713 RepID=UPI00261EF1AA|nr:TonB-dependent siderophore receptor [Neomegalonema sp.]MDD2867812.1 TonB-dependent siderophore receptor [Neomegalonema sp.]
MNEMAKKAAKARRARLLALLTTCAALGLASAPARAQTDAQTGLPAVGVFPVAIPAQPLDSALTAFSRQTGVQVLVAPEAAAGRNAAEAQGDLTPEAALTRLLSGTGLTFAFSGPGVATISAPPLPATAQAAPILLDTIYVGGAGGTWAPVAGVVAHRTGTGSKTDAEVIDIPASVSVITADELKARGVSDLDGALNYTAGVSTNLYGGDERYDFVAIRGFNQTTSGIYRDGLPIRNYNLTGGRVEPYGMERVEVLKGSTSTLYGANNPGGLVNMITKRPVDYKFGEVYATGGEDHLEFGADFGGPLDAEGVLTYRLTAKKQDSTLPNGVSSDDRLYVAPALTWKPGDRTAVTLMADYNERGGSNRYGIPRGSGIDPWTFLGEPGFETNDTTEWGVGYALEHDFQNGLVFRSHGRHMELDLLSENVYAAGNQHPDVGRLAWRVDSELSRDSVDAHLQYDLGFGRLKSRTLIGADYTAAETFEEIQQGTAGGLGDVADPVYCGRACVTLRPYYKLATEEETWGVYAQEELTLDDRWILTLGARYDEVEATATQIYSFFSLPVPIEEEAVTLRGGLTYKVDDDLSIYGTYSESFTPVLPSNQFALLMTESEPMMGEMYELGVKWRPPGVNGLFSAAVYDLTQTNVPRYKQFSGPPYFGIEQDGEVRSRGVELEGKAELTDRTNLILAYGYTDAEVTKSASGAYDGTRPMFIPEHTAAIWLDHTIPGAGARGDVTLGLGARYVGSRYANENNTFKLDPHVVFDAMAKYQITENTALTLNVENLFDKEYVSHVETWSEPDTEFYGTPQTFRLSLRHTW